MPFANSSTHRLALPRRSRASLVRTVATLFAVWRERRKLEALDDRLLDDIGVSPRDAWSEARRPLWESAARHNR